MIENINKWLISIWYLRRKAFWWLLPFAYIYQLIIFLRRILYQVGIKKVTRINIPVIVIGNLTVGGTGKTPLIIYLAHLLSKEGYNVGIVSRGYKGNYLDNYKLVKKESTAQEVGDEAVLFARHLDCPIVVSRKRVQGALFLQTLGCTVVLSDDGLQHYALGRDLEILVVDGSRGFGNGLCLPAGPLREPIFRLNTVDFCIVNCNTIEQLDQNFEIKVALPIFLMQFIPTKWINLKEPALSFENIKKRTLHAVTGIGNSERFFDQLRQAGFSIIPHTFADHYAFQKADFDFNADELIVMTEKDAVKCFDFADERYWYVPISAYLPPEFGRLFISKVGGIFKNR